MHAPIQVISHVGTDGVLSVAVPQGFSNSDVLVTAQPLASPESGTAGDRSDWQSFLKETYGACRDLDFDEPVDLPPQLRDWT